MSVVIEREVLVLLAIAEIKILLVMKDISRLYLMITVMDGKLRKSFLLFRRKSNINDGFPAFIFFIFNVDSYCSGYFGEWMKVRS